MPDGSKHAQQAILRLVTRYVGLFLILIIDACLTVCYTEALFIETPPIEMQRSRDQAARDFCCTSHSHRTHQKPGQPHPFPRSHDKEHSVLAHQTTRVSAN